MPTRRPPSAIRECLSSQGPGIVEVEGEVASGRNPRPGVLIVANFPLAVEGRNIVCPRARGWAKPWLSPLAAAASTWTRQVWLVSLVTGGGGR